ncbi:MAG: BCD family MFS transporter [Pseudomonadota bacterium]
MAATGFEDRVAGDNGAVDQRAADPAEVAGLGWLGIVRLGLIQTALGAIVVLTTSTLNRVMVVELGLLAMLPGLLVGLHYGIQMLRPRWGYGSDVGGHRTPWIIGGMAVLAVGGALAAAATALMSVAFYSGLLLSVVAFTLIGVGVGACGTNLLTLLATSVAPSRRAAAASTVWIMMIAGFVVTAITAGHFLDPFTMARLVVVASVVSALAFVVTIGAIWGIEEAHRKRLALASARTPQPAPPQTDAGSAQKQAFMDTLREVWAETHARRFTIFVFVSMLAYSMQDLILEPFAGIIFGMTPGQSTALAGTQNGGVLVGMIFVAIVGSLSGGSKVKTLRAWCVGGCLASAVSLVGLSIAAHVGPGWPIQASVFALGASNGAFAVAAIGSMMGLASHGREKREGTRMGLWGAAQAIAFGLGGLFGAVLVDISRQVLGTPVTAYSTVFAIEALLFVLSGFLALQVGRTAQDDERAEINLGGEALMEMDGR